MNLWYKLTEYEWYRYNKKRGRLPINIGHKSVWYYWYKIKPYAIFYLVFAIILLLIFINI